MKRIIFVLFTVSLLLSSCVIDTDDVSAKPVPRLVSESGVKVFAKSDASSDLTPEGMEFMNKLYCPAIAGIDNEMTADTYHDSILGYPITITRTEENGIYTFEGKGENVAIEVIYDEAAKEYSFIQVVKDSAENNGVPVPYLYYIVTVGDSIAYDASCGAWKGPVDINVFMKQKGYENYIYSNIQQGMYHADDLTAGIAIMHVVGITSGDPNGPGVSDPELNVDTAKGLLQSLEGKESNYYELVYFDYSDNSYAVYFNENLVGDDEAQRADLIDAAQRINPAWIISEDN